MFAKGGFKKIVACGVTIGAFLGGELCASEERIMHHIAPTQLRVLGEGLFVEIKGELYQVSKLKKNDEGYSVTAFPVNEWMCSNGHANWPWREQCRICPEKRNGS